MLEQTFPGSRDEVMALCLQKNDWHEDNTSESQQIRWGKGAGCKLLHSVVDVFFDCVMELVNDLLHSKDLLHSPELPIEWINIFPKHGWEPARPISSTRLLHRTCISLVSGRVGAILEAAQPQEQQRFSTRTPRWGRLRFGDNKFSYWQILGREHPDLDYQFGLAKFFARVRWPSLWYALTIWFGWFSFCRMYKKSGKANFRNQQNN